MHFITTAAYNFWPPLSKPVSGTFDSMYDAWPQWQMAMSVAQKCMARLSMHGSYKGMGVFVKSDELLVPKHLLTNGSNQSICGLNLNRLINSLAIYYTDEQFCYKPVKVSHILEDGGQIDYCLLKLDQNLPCIVPTMSFNSNLSECLFAEIVEDQLKVSIVSPCSRNKESMCGFVPNWTRPGSSGGIYLDYSGRLIAIHLGQSTGYCDQDTGVERKILLAQEIIRNSAYSCTLDHSRRLTRQPVCLSPVQNDVCYVPQSDVQCQTAMDKNGYYCKSKEHHLTNAARGIKIEVMQKDLKNKKNGIKIIANLFYQIFLVGPDGAERPNIHNNKSSSSSYTTSSAKDFYEKITQDFHNNLELLKAVNYGGFEFDFKKHKFVARLANLEF